MSAFGIPPDYASRRGLRLQVEATELVSVGTSPEGKDIRLTPAAAKAWEGMRDSAANSGIGLLPISGFRSIARQAEIIQAKLAGGGTIEEILSVVAAPGYSEHHTGRALDIGFGEGPHLTEDFAQTPAFAWLEGRAGAHEFTLSFPKNNAHGIAYEPWHWCYKAF